MNMWEEDSNQKMLSREESLALRVAKLEAALTRIKNLKTDWCTSYTDVAIDARQIAEEALK